MQVDFLSTRVTCHANFYYAGALERQLERDAMKRVREEYPNVEWLNSYVVLGPCDLHLHCQ